MTNILLPPSSGSSWVGGSYFFDNLKHALNQYAPDIHLIDRPDDLSLGSRKSFSGWKSRFLHKLAPRKWLNQRLEHDIDIVLNDPSWSDTFPSIAWIPDFQHLHLPGMFSSSELSATDKIYRDRCQTATRIFVSSLDVEKDLKTFNSQAAAKSKVISFVSHVDPSIYSIDTAQVVQKYGLPKKFIYLPNQFWRHKNHKLVFEALAILKKRGIDAFVVCTGQMSDHRNPDHITDLLKMISNLDIQKQVATLGLIDRPDVPALLRHSICVLNPSLFEGWSTSVEECKSIGKSILCSDIAVHREQAAPEATYFDPYSAESLSDVIAKAWITKTEGPDLALERSACANIRARQKIFAEKFSSLVREVLVAQK